MVAVVFYSLIRFFKAISMHFLKRKVIKAGHLDKADILGQMDLSDNVIKQIDRVPEVYPSLKWSLIGFFAGLGCIVIEVIRKYDPEMMNYEGMMPFGVLAISISIGFFIYFVIAKRNSNK